MIEKYREAGRIAKNVMEFGLKLIKVDASYLDIVESIEKRIHELGAKPAFPVNISINNIGAHDTADLNDSRVLKEGDLVKLDIGVHVDGYIADMARTVSLGSEDEEMIKVAERALKEAIKNMIPGNNVSTVSSIIEDTIKDSCFRPIVNLTGHGLDRYDLHAKLEFPNVRTNINYELKEGDVFALEPFVTNGAGMVKETNKVLIYRLISESPTRMRESRKILAMARNYSGLPFSKRWIASGISPVKLNLILKQLVDNGSLYEYPVLREADNGNIAQAEDTVVVRDRPEVIT
ncbi:MAG: type II methionyl aminopeptidase [Candidatus Aenigmatarchaeota archaeon]|nr:MAG: type II methionyl aminopeptidase [Candidatus Aenigmarchaeota archaeon]